MAAGLELDLEARCPVAAAHLITVNERTRQPGAYERPQAVDDGLYAAGPKRIQRLAAHLVALQSVSTGQCGVVGHASGCIANAHYGPASLGRIPCQRPISGGLCSQVYNIVKLYDSHFVHLAFFRHQMGSEMIVGQCFLIQIVDALPVLWSRKCKDGYVPVKVMTRVRFLQCDAYFVSALHLLLAPGYRLHGILGLHPRSAARRPSRAVVERQLHAQPLSLAGCVLEQLEPFVAHVFDGPLWEAHSAVEERGLVNAHTVHRLQVGRDTLARHVAVQPVPPGSYLSFFGWMGKTFS